MKLTYPKLLGGDLELFQARGICSGEDLYYVKDCFGILVISIGDDLASNFNESHAHGVIHWALNPLSMIHVPIMVENVWRRKGKPQFVRLRFLRPQLQQLLLLKKKVPSSPCQLQSSMLFDRGLEILINCETYTLGQRMRQHEDCSAMDHVEGCKVLLALQAE